MYESTDESPCMKVLWITEYGSTDGSPSMEVLMDH